MEEPAPDAQGSSSDDAKPKDIDSEFPSSSQSRTPEEPQPPTEQGKTPDKNHPVPQAPPLTPEEKLHADNLIDQTITKTKGVLQEIEAEERELASRKATGPKPIKAGHGPVVSGVLDTRTGKTYFGQNSLEADAPSPEDLEPVLRNRLKEFVDREGERSTSRAGVPGRHAEIAALNQALKARRELTGKPVTESELNEFLLHNRSLLAKKVVNGYPAGRPHRCTTCKELTKGVRIVDIDEDESPYTSGR